MSVRRLPEVDDGFRLEPTGPFLIVRRNFVPPVPVGSLVVRTFRVTGWGRDCDGSALATVEAVDRYGQASGWTQACVGLDSDSWWLVDHPDDLDAVAVDRESGNDDVIRYDFAQRVVGALAGEEGTPATAAVWSAAVRVDYISRWFPPVDLRWVAEQVALAVVGPARVALPKGLIRTIGDQVSQSPGSRMAVMAAVLEFDKVRDDYRAEAADLLAQVWPAAVDVVV